MIDFNQKVRTDIENTKSENERDQINSNLKIRNKGLQIICENLHLKNRKKDK